MNIAIIPARGGSKRIPRKNILDFCGLPVIAYSIQAAQKSGLFQHVIVSTDDREIAAVAAEYGALVPFVRPPELSNDHAATAPVIAHAVEEFAKGREFPENACCIYPCAPMISVGDLKTALEQLLETDQDFIYPVTDYPHPVYRAMKRRPDGKMEFVFPEHELTRTQDLPRLFHDVGQFYWGKARAWTSGKRMHTSGGSIVIPHWRVVDIDNLDDWRRAENLYRIIRDDLNK